MQASRGAIFQAALVNSKQARTGPGTVGERNKKTASNLRDKIDSLRRQPPTEKRKTNADGPWHDISPANRSPSCSPYTSASGMLRKIFMGWPRSDLACHSMTQRANLQRRA